jgi:hypothetical protein
MSQCRLPVRFRAACAESLALSTDLPHRGMNSSNTRHTIDA